MKHLQMLPFLIIFLFTLVMPQSCLAHKVRIFAWQEGAKILTESKFSGGKVAQQVTISVVDTASGNQLLSGTTDSEGLFSFPIPLSGVKELDIVVDGGDGHRNSWKYQIEQTPTTDGSPKQATTNPPKEQKEVQAPDNMPIAPPSSPLDTAELTRLLEEIMDKQLSPIRRSLAENAEKGPSIQDIIGGIGYILGLAGIAAYMQSLKNKKE